MPEQELGFGPSSQRDPLEDSQLGSAAVTLAIYVNESGRQQEGEFEGEKIGKQADQLEGKRTPDQKTSGQPDDDLEGLCWAPVQPVGSCFVHSSSNNALGHMVYFSVADFFF